MTNMLNGMHEIQMNEMELRSLSHVDSDDDMPPLISDTEDDDVIFVRSSAEPNDAYRISWRHLMNTLDIFESRGYSRNIFAREKLIPEYLYMKKKTSGSAEPCPVCLEDFKDGEEVKLKNCHHNLCVSCSYSLRHRECPLCRSNF